MSNTIRIKRRASGGGNAAGAPSSLKNGELAYNEVDDILYYGKGVSGGNAATIPGIAGSGAYVNLTTAQTVAGVKTFTSLLKADGGIAVDTNKFTVADGSGNTSIAGTLAVTGDTALGTISAGTWTATDIAVAHGGTGASTAAAAASNLGLGTEDSPEFTQVTVSGSGGFVGSGAGLTSIPAGQLTGNINKDRLPVATSANRGAIELFSDTTQSVTAESVSTTSSRTYGIQLNSAGQAVVNVPWENDNTQLTDAQVRSKISGTGLISYNDSTGVISTTANNYSLPEATATVRGGIELFSNTAQSEAANTVSTTSNRTYGIQLNSAGQAVVNVPWDANTNTFRTVQADGSAIGSSETLNLIGGTNVTLSESNGAITIASTATATLASLGISTTDDVSFGNLEVGSGETTATIKGPATLTIDPAAHGDNTGKVVIAGDLQVDGTTTTVNSTTVEIDDLAIELAHDATTSALINGAGLRFGTNSSGEAVHSFEYVHADTRMVLTPGLLVSGGLQNTVLTSCTIDGGTF